VKGDPPLCIDDFATGLLLKSFNVFAEASFGMERLREIILELALQGRLVPQDPGDRPAADLLRSITPRGENGASPGRRGKAVRSALETAPDEGSLPNSWEVVPLGMVLDVQNGFAFKSRFFTESADGVPLIRIRDLGTGTTVAHYMGDYSEEYLVTRGDYLIGMDGNFEIHEWDGPEALLNQRVCRLQDFTPEVDRQYVFWVVSRALKEIHANTSFVTVKHLSSRAVRAIRLPLPPLPEQRRIAAKLHRLMALCDDLEEQQHQCAEKRRRLNFAALHRLYSAANDCELRSHWKRIHGNFDLLYDAPEVVDDLRRAVLQLAVRGKLVPEEPTKEPANSLLQRVKEEKRRLYEDGQITRPQKLPSVDPDEAPWEVPKSWKWTRLGTIADHRLGKMLDKRKNTGDLYPYLRNANVQWLRFDLQDVKELRLETDELEKYRVQKGDLLICEGGEPGRGAIWDREDVEMYFQKALHRVRPLCDIDPWYLLYHLQADALGGRLAQYFTGATIKHLTGQALAQYEIALPPLDEQRRIVAKVDKLRLLCDSLGVQLNRSWAMARRLGAAIRHQIASA